MKPALLSAAGSASVFWLLASGVAGAQTFFLGPPDLRWAPVAQQQGVQRAPLWGAAAATGAAQGEFQRWRATTKAPSQVLSQDLHVVVLAGTLTVTVGSTYRELGPGSYVGIPKGVAHVLGCEAAGECRLLFHQGAAAEVTEKKP